MNISVTCTDLKSVDLRSENNNYLLSKRLTAADLDQNSTEFLNLEKSYFSNINEQIVYTDLVRELITDQTNTSKLMSSGNGLEKRMKESFFWPHRLGQLEGSGRKALIKCNCYPLQLENGRLTQRNADAKIVKDLVESAESYDYVILMSGDSDFCETMTGLANKYPNSIVIVLGQQDSFSGESKRRVSNLGYAKHKRVYYFKLETVLSNVNPNNPHNLNTELSKEKMLNRIPIPLGFYPEDNIEESLDRKENYRAAEIRFDKVLKSNDKAYYIQKHQTSAIKKKNKNSNYGSRY